MSKKKRLIAKIIIKNGIVVQSINFKRFLPVGSVMNTIEFFNDWQADEIFLVDISKNVDLKKNIDLLNKVSEHNTLPICYGGGIRSIKDVRHILRAGADKVSVNSLTNDHNCLSSISNIFGSQCLIVSLDIKKTNNEYYIYNKLKNSYFKLSRIEIKKLEDCGVGEFFVQSIDNDGSKLGFDTVMIKKFLKYTNKPVILSSGYGQYNDVCKIIKSDISAIAIGNGLHFEELSILKIKKATNHYLKKKIFRIEKFL